MASFVPRLFALLLLLLAGTVSAQIAIPTLGSRGEIAPDRTQAFDALIDTFTQRLRAEVAARGVSVGNAEMATPGIAGSLDPEYAKLIAELDGTRYAISGEIALATNDRIPSPFLVNIIVVDAQQDRASDLISRPLDEETLAATAENLAEVIVAFMQQAVALPPGDAGLFVSSEPIEAEIFLNGVRVGETPYTDVLMLAPGRYRLELRKEGFLPEVRTVELRSQATTFERVHLAAIAGGSILVESTPPGEVFMGGVSQGFTPLFIPAAPGVPTVRVERDGFEPAVAAVPVRNYRTSRLDLTLEPVREPLLFWEVDREYFVIIDGAIQPGGYARTVEPGLIEIEISRGRESRRYSVVLPARGVFELDLESGEVSELEE